MLEVKELIILHNLCTDHVTVRSELTFLIGAKSVGTVNMEPRSGSNPAKYPRFYVRAGYQPAKTIAGRVFGRVWNRTEPNRRSKPGPLAGYPDPLLTLPYEGVEKVTKIPKISLPMSLVFEEEKCSQALLDFLGLTDVGRFCGVAEEAENSDHEESSDWRV